MERNIIFNIIITIQNQSSLSNLLLIGLIGILYAIGKLFIGKLLLPIQDGRQPKIATNPRWLCQSKMATNRHLQSTSKSSCTEQQLSWKWKWWGNQKRPQCMCMRNWLLPPAFILATSTISWIWGAQREKNRREFHFSTYIT